MKDCTFKLYASSAYLEQHGVPLSMEDLLHKHRSIIYSQDGTRPFSMADGFINREKVNFKQGMQPITVNSVQAMLTLAQQGLGIVSLERDMKVLKTNGLQRILESEYEFTAGVYLVYPKLFEETKEIELLDRFFLKTSIGSKPEN